MLRGRAARPACADAQLPESMASNTPRQSFGTATVRTGGVGWTTGDGCCVAVGAAWSAAGAVRGGIGAGAPRGAGGLTGRGASGSGEDCPKTGAAQIKAPNAINPDFKLRPPSAAASPSMPRTCLRVD